MHRLKTPPLFIACFLLLAQLPASAAPPADPAESQSRLESECNTIEITTVGRALTLWVNAAVTCRFEDCGRDKGSLGLEARATASSSAT